MPRIHRSLTKVALPPDLAASITSLGYPLTLPRLGSALTEPDHSESNRERSHSCRGRQCFRVQRPELDSWWLGVDGEREGCLPCRSCGSTDEVNPKLILLSTHDDSFEIFFDPRTREFYTITVENEEEGNERDETLLGNASQLAHSVREGFSLE